MFAYTAWDSLQVIARQFDADIVSAPDESIALAPRGSRTVACATVRGIARRLLSGLTNLPGTSSRRAS
jgi:hypothetical protein